MYLLSENQLSAFLLGLPLPQVKILLSTLSSTLAQLSQQEQVSTETSKKLIHQPQRSVITTHNGFTISFMPASVTTMTGIKIVAVPTNSDIVGVINIFDSEGKLVGLLSAAELTAFRTALATMSLFTRCRQISRASIVIFGAGKQAEWHARLALILDPGAINKITLVNRSRDRVERLIRALTKSITGTSMRVKIVSLVQADQSEAEYRNSLSSSLAESEVIFCCTPSTKPLFPASFLVSEEPRSRFISLIGSFKPHMREIDTETLLSGGSRVYVDLKEACLKEAGEIIQAGLEEGNLIEIGEVFASGKEILFTRPGENILFKSVGFGLMDIAVARDLIELAKDSGVGTEVDGF